MGGPRLKLGFGPFALLFRLREEFGHGEVLAVLCLAFVAF